MLSKLQKNALAGLVLALGAPLGLLVLRVGLTAVPMSPELLRDEISGDWITYAYVAFSTSVAFALFGALLGRKLDRSLRSALTDPLTGAWNRRQLDAKLNEEIQRTRRYATPLALVLLDVDRLKAINDDAGHEAGDRALIAAARALQASCRETDLVARFGGDEFAVLAPHTDAQAALELVQRALSAARSSDVGPQRLTLSAGVADLESVDAVEASALWNAADLALYRAKQAGRDRVERAPARSAGTPAVVDRTEDARGSA